MESRGRILRDTSTGVGLISIKGQQHEFTLEGVWQSDIAPKTDMVVDVQFGSDGKILSVTAVSDADLAKAQAEKAIHAIKNKGAAVFDDAALRIGKPILIAVALLIVAWFFLNSINIQVSSNTKIGLTFWDILGFVNTSVELDSLRSAENLNKGIYGFFAICALAGPFIFQAWKNPLAHLGNCLPLLLILISVAVMYNGVQDAIAQTENMGSLFSGSSGKNFASSMAEKMFERILSAIHVGIGAYLSIAASAYLAFMGVIKYLAAKA